MPITRTAWTDDDGTGTTGTILNNAQKTALYDDIDGMSLTTLFVVAASPTIWAASQNNFAVGSTVISNVSASSPVNLTGMVPVRANQIVTLVNVGAQTITIKHESASSTAANRFFMTGAADISLPSNAVRTFVYTAATSRWRPVVDG